MFFYIAILFLIQTMNKYIIIIIIIIIVYICLCKFTRFHLEISVLVIISIIFNFPPQLFSVFLLIMNRVLFRARNRPFEISSDIMYSFRFYLQLHTFVFFNNKHALNNGLNFGSMHKKFVTAFASLNS